MSKVYFSKYGIHDATKYLEKAVTLNFTIFCIESIPANIIVYSDVVADDATTLSTMVTSH